MADLEHRVGMFLLCHSWETALTVNAGVWGDARDTHDFQPWRYVQVLISHESKTWFPETLP